MNELTSLLRRAFEALGYCQGDYEDAARAIIWLESRGMQGLELAMRDWQRLSKAGRALDVTAAGNDVLVVDAHDSSILTCGRSVVDLAAATLEQKARCRMEIRQCYSRTAIVPSLESCARRGAGAVAYWRDGNYQHVAKIDAQCTHPEYRSMQIKPENTASPTMLNLACDKEPQEIDAILTELAEGAAPATPDCHVSPPELDTRYQAAIRQGLAVNRDLADRLAAIAEAVLVTATEQSRRGAGET
jgi:hypothetical protein